MTTLVMPTFERRLLRAVAEELAAEPVRDWPEQSLQLCLSLVETIRQNIAKKSRGLEEVLTEGVEARSFARSYSPLLPAADEQLTQVRGLLERLAPGEDPVSERLTVELRSLERELEVFRTLLSETLSRTSEAPPGVDQARVRAAEEAHARGETKRFPVQEWLPTPTG